MKIKVTEQHIADGRRWQVGSCPIALALIEAGFENVWVCSDYIKIGISRIPVPEEVRTFVLNFDSNFLVQPFEFEIKLPLLLRLQCLFK